MTVTNSSEWGCANLQAGPPPATWWNSCGESNYIVKPKPKFGVFLKKVLFLKTMYKGRNHCSELAKNIGTLNILRSQTPEFIGQSKYLINIFCSMKGVWDVRKFKFSL